MLTITYKGFDDQPKSLRLSQIRAVQYARGSFGISWAPLDRFVRWGRFRLEWVKGSGLFFRRYPSANEFLCWHLLFVFQKA